MPQNYATFLKLVSKVKRAIALHCPNFPTWTAYPESCSDQNDWKPRRGLAELMGSLWSKESKLVWQPKISKCVLKSLLVMQWLVLRYQLEQRWQTASPRAGCKRRMPCPPQLPQCKKSHHMSRHVTWYGEFDSRELEVSNFFISLKLLSRSCLKALSLSHIISSLWLTIVLILELKGSLLHIMCNQVKL